MKTKCGKIHKVPHTAQKRQVCGYVGSESVDGKGE